MKKGYEFDMLKDLAPGGDTSKLQDAAKKLGSFGYDTKDDDKAGSGIMALLNAVDLTKVIS